ncbi:hypothetical protein ACFSLT_11790 [Novosphingobium resinovorum]
MKPETGQCVLPRLRDGPYQMRTSLQSLFGETSSAVTLRSISPGTDQLAWLSSTVRASTMRLTVATWPSFELLNGLIAITAPTRGDPPVA